MYPFQVDPPLTLLVRDPLHIDFTLSNARRFYSSKGDPLAVKGLRSSIGTKFTHPEALDKYNNII